MRPSSSFPSVVEPVAGPPRRASAWRSGFSLVEILAALVLTGLLTAVLMPFFSGLLGRWMTGQRAIEDGDMWMRATIRLAGDSARAVPVVVGEGRGARVFYRGDEREVVFVRPALSVASSTALETVTWRIDRAGDGEALVRLSRPFQRDGLERPLAGGEAETTILSGPYRLRFVHLSEKGDRLPVWDKSDAMPRLIELQVEATGRRPAPPAPIAMPIPAFKPRAAETAASPAGGTPATATVPGANVR